MTAKKSPSNRYPPYLLARQIAALKRLSDDTGTPVMHYIREAIDEYLEKRKRKKKKSSQ
jgi:predicted DNA-binding protein